MVLKVLTVDDSKTIRMIVRKAFQPYDCAVVEAENGVEGLAAAARERPNLIVLDITMPVMNGVEMLERLKAEADLKEIPVIMLTAESGKDNVVNILKKGIKDYMVKPFKGEELIERVKKIVPLSAREGGQAEEEKTTDRFFRQIRDIVFLSLPDKVTRSVTMEVEAGLPAKTKEMAGAGLRKMILDLGGVAETNVSLIKLIITTIQHCQKAGVAVKLVASRRQGEELKGFQETSQITLAHSIDEARAAF
jgi:DNA-binding response OmpR family regulator